MKRERGQAGHRVSLSLYIIPAGDQWKKLPWPAAILNQLNEQFYWEMRVIGLTGKDMYLVCEEERV